MKRSLFCGAAALLLYSLLPYTSVCAADEAKPCCAPMESAAPLPDKSVYQLDASWTNDAGHTVKLADLRGEPVVLTMFFASCQYACPVLVEQMQEIRAALPEAVRAKTHFVLVTFDLKRDTVEALRAYRERMQLDDGWILLRGTPDSVEELAAVLGVRYKQDANGDFAHSNLITFLNPDGEIASQQTGLQANIPQAVAVLDKAQSPKTAVH